MCCGAKAAMRQQSLRKIPTMEGLTLIRYLGRDIGTTWQAFSRRSYIVSATEPVFGVLPVDVNWFLAKFERGKQLFALEVPPVVEPVVAPEPVVEFSVVEEVVAEHEQLQVEDDGSEPEAKPKRTRKPKAE